MSDLLYCIITDILWKYIQNCFHARCIFRYIYTVKYMISVVLFMVPVVILSLSWNINFWRLKIYNAVSLEETEKTTPVKMNTQSQENVSPNMKLVVYYAVPVLVWKLRIRSKRN